MDHSKTHLRQEHLARSEELPDGGHAGYEGTLDDIQRSRVPLGVRPRQLGVLYDEGVNALDQGMPGEEKVFCLTGKQWKEEHAWPFFLLFRGLSHKKLRFKHNIH